MDYSGRVGKYILWARLGVVESMLIFIRWQGYWKRAECHIYIYLCGLQGSITYIAATCIEAAALGLENIA